MALTRRLIAFLSITIGGFLAPGFDAAMAAADAAFSVVGVAVDVTAANAETARKAALADGQQRAFRQLLERLVPEADHGRLPKLSDSAVTELVRGYEVSGERVGPNRYIASLTFHFKPGEVGDLLRNRNIPYAAAASTPIPAQARKGIWSRGR